MMKDTQTAFLHYTAPPVVGGVEAVIQAHARVFQEAGYPVTVIAGNGKDTALPPGTDFILLPEMDSQHPWILEFSPQLEEGQVPSGFKELVDFMAGKLKPILKPFDNVIVHNLFGKHFNLPLTAALVYLLETGAIHNCIAWGHDFTWTSPHSKHKVHPGYPWDLLRTYRQDMTYVAVSQKRQRELASLLGCSLDEIHVVYNGVDPEELLGLSEQGKYLVEHLGLMESDLLLLMPVRVTQAKNIEFALRVVAAIKAKGIQPKLVLTGPPDPHDEESMKYFRSLQTLRQQLGVEQEMHFVFESGPDPDQPYMIDLPAVGDLFRVSDVMFMPSHREGFGMPVLEAGLAAVPVVTTEVPAAQEIGGEDLILFSEQDEAEQIATKILAWAEDSKVHRLRRRVRQHYTWQAIFRRDIEPLLERGERH